MKQAKEGLNPFQGFEPSVPKGERLTTGSPMFAEFEQSGLQQIAKKTAM